MSNESKGKRKTAKKPVRRRTAKKEEEAATPLMAGESFAATAATHSTRTRRNLSGVIPRTDRYKNIEDGLVPYKYSTSGVKTNNNIDIRDAVILCQKAYYNFSTFRNVVDLMTEFSVSQIFFKGGNKRSRDFFQALMRKLNIFMLQDRFFREYYRSGNVFFYRFDAKLQTEDAVKISQTYGADENKNVKLPANYLILNPADIQLGGVASFHRPKYYKILNGYELMRLQNPETDEDKEFLSSLDSDTRQKLKNNKKVTTVLMPLNPTKIQAVFYKKQDYEPFAVPFGFPVLEDINYKAELKKMDMAVGRTMQQAILLVTMGTEPDKGGVNYKQLKAMQDLFANQSVGRVLIADYTTKAQFVIPQIADLLDPRKYEVVDRDIQLGLNNILGLESSFANQSAKIDLFLARLKEGQRAFLYEFLIPEIKRISKDLGFKSFPTPYFDRIDLKDNTNLLRVYNRLVELGVLTAEEGIEAVETGRLPDGESSVKSQEEFLKLKDKGLYDPLIGGKNKEEGQGGPNQQTKKTDKETGRPKGTPQNAEKSPVGEGEKSAYSSEFSLKKVTENMVQANSLFEKVEKALKKQHKKTRLTKAQKEVSTQITELIIANENPENWEGKIETYIKTPVDQNPERIKSIQEIALEHQVDDYLASILYASKV